MNIFKFFDNMIKAREEWLANSTVPNTAIYLKTGTKTYTKTYTKIDPK